MIFNCSFLLTCILTQIIYKNYEKVEIEKKRGTHTLKHSLSTTMPMNNTPI